MIRIIHYNMSQRVRHQWMEATNKVRIVRVVGQRQTEGSQSCEWLRPVDVQESCSILSSVCSFVTMTEAPEIDCGRRWGSGRSLVDTLFARVIRSRDTCTSPHHATPPWRHPSTIITSGSTESSTILFHLIFGKYTLGSLHKSRIKIQISSQCNKLIALLNYLVEINV